MKTRWILLVCCLYAFASNAQETKVQMWKWTDANGVVHYSDVPAAGAVRVDLAVPQGQPGQAPSATAASSAAPSDGQAATTYSSLTIVKPESEESFFGADAVVDVELASEPALADSDTVNLYLDGKRVGNSGKALSFSLPGIERGAHTLLAVIFDSKGKEKIRSPQLVFFMKPPIANNPAAVGPTLRPKPKSGG
jgi:hypothetical protein